MMKILVQDKDELTERSLGLCELLVLREVLLQVRRVSVFMGVVDVLLVTGTICVGAEEDIFWMTIWSPTPSAAVTELVC